MAKKEYDYEEDCKIDIYSLEIEWRDHTSKVQKYGDLWAENMALREHQQDKIDRLKDELLEEKARLNNEIKQNWAKYNITKSPTDKSAENWTLLQDSYKEKLKEFYEAKSKLVDLKETENKLKVVYYDICQNQKASLENLVKLHLNEYYSEPQARGQDERDVVKVEKKNKEPKEIVCGMKPNTRKRTKKGE